MFLLIFVGDDYNADDGGDDDNVDDGGSDDVDVGHEIKRRKLDY